METNLETNILGRVTENSLCDEALVPLMLSTLFWSVHCFYSQG